MQATKAELRGSQKLLASFGTNGEMPNIDEIRRGLKLPESVKIPNWLVRGTPVSFLQLEATLQVPIAHLSEVVDRFVRLDDSTINLHVLINGIPKPDIAEIVVRNTPGPR